MWVGLCVVSLLTACGGGGGSADRPDRALAADRLARQLAQDNIVDPGRLPNRGSARFAGFMNADLPLGAGGARERYIGDLALDVDFASDKGGVTGRADKFATRDGKALDGGLRVRGSTLFRKTDTDDNYSFAGRMGGKLRDGATPYTIAADISGDFRGRDAAGVNGVIFGDINGPDGQDIFDGDFAARRK